MRLRDVFQIQDEIVHRIVEALSLPLTACEHRRPFKRALELNPDLPIAHNQYAHLEAFSCLPAFARDPWLDPLRSSPDFVAALWQVEARPRQAVGSFEEVGGDRRLGVPAEPGPRPRGAG